MSSTGVDHGPHLRDLLYAGNGGGFTWSLRDRDTGRSSSKQPDRTTDKPIYAPVDGMIVKLRESRRRIRDRALNDIYYNPSIPTIRSSGSTVRAPLLRRRLRLCEPLPVRYRRGRCLQKCSKVELRFGPGQKGTGTSVTSLRTWHAHRGRGYVYGGSGMCLQAGTSTKRAALVGSSSAR